jgi:hypothetical protein
MQARRQSSANALLREAADNPDGADAESQGARDKVSAVADGKAAKPEH